MHQSKWGVLLNSQGYTLIEALFQFIVFILLSNIIIMIVFWMHQMNSTFFTNEHVSWELFVQDVQEYFVNVDSVKITNNFERMEIYEKNSLDSKQIDRLGDVIRLRKNNQGYVPLLIGVKSAQFTIEDGFLTISVEFLNGLKKERTIFVE